MCLTCLTFSTCLIWLNCVEALEKAETLEYLKEPEKINFIDKFFFGSYNRRSRWIIEEVVKFC